MEVVAAPLGSGGRGTRLAPGGGNGAARGVGSEGTGGGIGAAGTGVERGGRLRDGLGMEKPAEFVVRPGNGAGRGEAARGAEDASGKGAGLADGPEGEACGCEPE